MIANFDLSQLFSFPLKDDEARKNFLITSLVYLAAFVIPILPLILVMGYAARIMRQVFNGEAPRMPAWDDWESMLKDGVYIFGVRMVYMLPLFIILFPLMFGMVFLPLITETNHGNDPFLIGFPILVGLIMLLVFPLSLALGIILPAAEAHVIAKSDFAAGFRIREWWAIFRANWSGFLIAYVIAMVAGMILSTVIGIAMATIVLMCVLPFITPAISAYLTLVMYTAFAQAYKDGKDRLVTTPMEIPDPQ